MIPHKAVLLISRFLSTLMKIVPMKLLLPISQSYLNSKPGTLKNTFLSFFLDIIATKKLNFIDTFTIPDNPKIKFKNNNSYIARRLYWFGQLGYELSEGNWWKNYCRNAQNILEIGANIGYYTVIGAMEAPRTKYVAVEPHPNSAKMIRENLEINKIENVTVIEGAVVGGKIAEQMKLIIPSDDHQITPTTAHLQPLNYGKTEQKKQSISVKIIEGKELIQDVDLIKIDAEGSEENILSSIKEYLVSECPPMFIEMLKKNTKLRKLIIDLMKECNYNVYAIGKIQLHKLSINDIPWIDLNEKFGTNDVILDTKELDD